jgi:hypothetical protein
MTITELVRIGDVILSELGEKINYVRSVITVVNGTVISSIGQVLGKVMSGTSVSAPAGAGALGANTGTGTLTVDPTTPVLEDAQSGAYRAVCILAAANAGTFQIYNPAGKVLGTIVSAITTPVTWANEIKFALLTVVGTNFVVGDAFTITVTAVSKYEQVNPSATDGSQYAAAVLLQPIAATLTADTAFVALTSGPVVLKASGLQWTAGMTAAQILTATAQLQAAGMKTEQAYGV